MTYFPLLIKLSDSGNFLVVNTPEDIPIGVSFKVIETNYKVNP